MQTLSQNRNNSTGNLTKRASRPLDIFDIQKLQVPENCVTYVAIQICVRPSVMYRYIGL